VEPHIQRDEDGLAVRVWVSAQSGEGLELLAQAMAERLSVDVIQESVVLEPAEARLRAQFYEIGAVVSESIADDGRQQLDLRLQRSDLNRLLKREGWQMDAFIEQHALQ
jgi:GTP-binding protein HflX